MRLVDYLAKWAHNPGFEMSLCASSCRLAILTTTLHDTCRDEQHPVIAEAVRSLTIGFQDGRITADQYMALLQNYFPLSVEGAIANCLRAIRDMADNIESKPVGGGRVRMLQYAHRRCMVVPLAREYGTFAFDGAWSGFTMTCSCVGT